jgi:N-sulfoglucosamine sulfohydrolase
MYYPMRVVRARRYKLIWNIAHPLPFPFASDLWAAPTWQSQYQQGMDASYGQRTVGQYIHRPKFELFDLEVDPAESQNVAADPAYAEVLEGMIVRLKKFQEETDDPWILKWRYE